MKILEAARRRLDVHLNGGKPELRTARDQTAAERDKVTFIREFVEESRGHASRVAHEGIWLTNIAYILGFDSVFYDTTLRQFRPLQSPSQFMRRHRVHVNKILPTVQNRMARLCKSPPRYGVRPKSSDDSDKDAARLGLQFINYMWEMERINQQRLELMMWVQQCGHAYLKICWDPTKGEKIEDPETGELVSEGDIRVDVASAFEVFPDPLAKSWRECRKLVHAKIRPLDYFRDQYERGHLVKEEECWLTSLQYQQRVNSFNASGGSTSSSSEVKNSAIELSYYELPSKKYPNGRHLIEANGVLLKDDELPVDELPFAKFDDVLIGGKYNSEAIVTQLRPIQDQYNRTLSQRAAWVNRMLAGKYLAARGHGLIAEALNDQSGEVVEYDPVPNAREPHAMETPSIPSYAYEEDDRHERNMYDIAGINEATRGQMPSASIPAIGMQFLVEQDDTRIGVMTENHEYGYADVGRIMLKMAYVNYKTKRKIKIAGNNMDYLIKDIEGADFAENFDVFVVRGSTLPGSKVLRRQEIINLHQGGYFGDPTDPTVLEKVLSMLEYGEVSEAWKGHALDKGLYNRRIKELEEGWTKPHVSEFDNHPFLFREYNEYRKSEKFEELDGEQQVMLLETLEEHLMHITKMAAPQVMAENEDVAPDMQESTAAQELEAQMMAEQGPRAEQILEEPPAGEELPQESPEMANQLEQEGPMI